MPWRIRLHTTSILKNRNFMGSERRGRFHFVACVISYI